MGRDQPWGTVGAAFAAGMIAGAAVMWVVRPEPAAVVVPMVADLRVAAEPAKDAASLPALAQPATASTAAVTPHVASDRALAAGDAHSNAAVTPHVASDRALAAGDARSTAAVTPHVASDRALAAGDARSNAAVTPHVASDRAPVASRVVAPAPSRDRAVAEVKGALARTAPRKRVQAPGRLKIVVRPWATVTVDGVAAGDTPFEPLTLAAGTHEVVLENGELNKRWVQKVAVTSGEMLVIDYDFAEPEAATRTKPD